MDDPDGVLELVVSGYSMCRRCGDWFVPRDGVTEVRMCAPCARERAREDEMDPVPYEVEGRRFITRPVHRPRPPLDQAALDYWRLVDRARTRAKTRLTQIYRPMYEMLMAEEKGRVGLPATFISHAPRPRETTRVVEEQAEQSG